MSRQEKVGCCSWGPLFIPSKHNHKVCSHSTHSHKVCTRTWEERNMITMLKIQFNYKVKYRTSLLMVDLPVVPVPGVSLSISVRAWGRGISGLSISRPLSVVVSISVAISIVAISVWPVPVSEKNMLQLELNEYVQYWRAPSDCWLTRSIRTRGQPQHQRWGLRQGHQRAQHQQTSFRSSHSSHRVCSSLCSPMVCSRSSRTRGQPQHQR